MLGAGQSSSWRKMAIQRRYGLWFTATVNDCVLSSSTLRRKQGRDLYIPAISLAIEIDEPHHDRQQDEDIVRQKLIEEKLNSDFVRLKVKGRMESESLFDQVEELFKTIENRINTYNPAPWEIKKTSRHMTPSQPSKEQGYSEENLRKLSEATTFRSLCRRHDLRLDSSGP